MRAGFDFHSETENLNKSWEIIYKSKETSICYFSKQIEMLNLIPLKTL